jgi:uracil-DNA glycosylase
MRDVKIEPSWKAVLESEFEKPYFGHLTQSVRIAYETTTVYPPPRQVFAAFDLCPLPKVKVVILGQDPYHGPGQAHGLAFSVQESTPLPPSLLNIYKEIENDIGIPITRNGDLTRWAKQGVFLLNSTLTVQASEPGSHQRFGWEQFTNEVIRTLSEKTEHTVFLLWGAFAIAKRSYIDAGKHLILTAPHPSPLSAHRGFFGSKHFSQCNDYLAQHGKNPIQW